MRHQWNPEQESLLKKTIEEHPHSTIEDIYQLMKDDHLFIGFGLNSSTIRGKIKSLRAAGVDLAARSNDRPTPRRRTTRMEEIAIRMIEELKGSQSWNEITRILNRDHHDVFGDHPATRAWVQELSKQEEEREKHMNDEMEWTATRDEALKSLRSQRPRLSNQQIVERLDKNPNFRGVSMTLAKLRQLAAKKKIGWIGDNGQDTIICVKCEVERPTEKNGHGDIYQHCVECRALRHMMPIADEETIKGMPSLTLTDVTRVTRGALWQYGLAVTFVDEQGRIMDRFLCEMGRCKPLPGADQCKTMGLTAVNNHLRAHGINCMYRDRHLRIHAPGDPPVHPDSSSSNPTSKNLSGLSFEEIESSKIVQLPPYRGESFTEICNAVRLQELDQILSWMYTGIHPSDLEETRGDIKDQTAGSGDEVVEDDETPVEFEEVDEDMVLG